MKCDFYYNTKYAIYYLYYNVLNKIIITEALMNF